MKGSLANTQCVMLIEHWDKVQHIADCNLDVYLLTMVYLTGRLAINSYFQPDPVSGRE